MTIQNTKITNNIANIGGFLYGKLQILSLTDSNFSQNSADEKGGAIFTNLSSLLISNSYFDSN